MTNLRAAIARNRLLKPPHPPKRRKNEEHDFQSMAIQFLEVLLPPDAVCTSFDLANAYSQATGAQRKRRGCLPGVADIYVATASVTLWIECKARKGKLSPDQEAFRDAVLAIGHFWCMATTLEQIEVALRATPIPLRGVTLLPAKPHPAQRDLTWPKLA